MNKALTILLTTASLFLLASCTEMADFTEYRNINYLNTLTLDAGPAGLEVNWVPDDATDIYMTFTSILVPPTINGLPASASDYSRLEILNLMPDGGFETGVAGWNPFNGGSAAAQPGNGLTVNSTDQSMQFAVNSTQRIDYDLESLPGFVNGGEYLIKLKFNRNLIGNAIFDHNNGALPGSYISYDFWKPPTHNPWGGNYHENFSALITAETGAGNDYFSIGSTIHGDNQLGYIDDVRIIRSDTQTPLFLRSTVPFNEAGRPELISGNYRFSIYVLKEDVNDVQPINVNRYASEFVTLSINSNLTTIDVSSVTSGTWVKISAEKFIQVYENDAISLSVSPCDMTSPYNKDAGSILISYPELEYISE